MRYLLEIHQLSVSVGENLLLNQVSFKAGDGRITALVGGSGSGKTTIANAVLGLLPEGFEIIQGEIIFGNKNLRLFNADQMRLMRGGQIGMVFQEPLGAFNPLMRIGSQIDEVLCVHTSLDHAQRRRRVMEVLARVELPNPEVIYQRYPHQLSGGERQRAMVALALSGEPRLIIADEPTSNLDVISQARLMGLFRRLRQEGVSFLLISHDLGMVAHLADEVIILEKGRVVESGPVSSVMRKPSHPYTKKLMEIVS